MMPRILIFDQQTAYRQGLRIFVGAQLACADDVFDSSDLNDALSQIRNRVFDLVLVGTGRSGLGALDLLKTAREATPSTRFAIVSACDTRADILAALAAGFHGFISKQQPDAEILAAITYVLSGQIYVPTTLTEASNDEVRSSQFDREALPTHSTEADVAKLTKRQHEVLSLLARGLSNKEIARVLDIAEATTKIHMAALLRALGARNRTEAAFKAIKITSSTGQSVPYPAARENEQVIPALDELIGVGSRTRVDG